MQDLIPYGPQPRSGVTPSFRPTGPVQGTIRMSADLGRVPHLTVIVERLPGGFAMSHGWTETLRRRFDAGDARTWPTRPVTFTVPDPGLGLRIRWEARATLNTTDGDPALELGISVD